MIFAAAPKTQMLPDATSNSAIEIRAVTLLLLSVSSLEQDETDNLRGFACGF